MPKIIGIKIHEYHIPAEGNSPARDFSGYKICVSMEIAPEDGWGEFSAEYRVSKQEFERKIPGFFERDIPSLIGAECGVDLAPDKDGKFKLIRLRVVQ